MGAVWPSFSSPDSEFPLLTWWAFGSQAPDFWEGQFPCSIPIPIHCGLIQRARNCFLQPAQGTVLLLFHLSISSEYSPRARQTGRVYYQDSLSWVLASPAQIPIHTTEERHHCRERVCLWVSLSHSVEAQPMQLTWILAIFYTFSTNAS